MTYNLNNHSSFAPERRFDAPEYLSEAFHFGLLRGLILMG
jgi:hypothetical protein